MDVTVQMGEFQRPPPDPYIGYCRWRDFHNGFPLYRSLKESVVASIETSVHVGVYKRAWLLPLNEA